jgi:Ca2+/H+ antiporter
MRTAPEAAAQEPAAKEIACRVARAWVRLYTMFVAPETRARRRAEVNSDLWDQLADARANHEGMPTTEIDVIRRVVAGVPADLAWVRRTRRSMKEIRPMKQRRLRTIVLVCAAIVVTNFVIANMVVDDFSTLADIWWWLSFVLGFLVVGTIGLVAAGLLIRERRRASLSGPTVG